MTTAQKKILEAMTTKSMQLYRGPYSSWLWGPGREADMRPVSLATITSLAKAGLIRQVARAEPVAVFVAVES